MKEFSHVLRDRPSTIISPSNWPINVELDHCCRDISPHKENVESNDYGKLSSRAIAAPPASCEGNQLILQVMAMSSESLASDMSTIPASNCTTKGGSVQAGNEGRPSCTIPDIAESGQINYEGNPSMYCSPTSGAGCKARDMDFSKQEFGDSRRNRRPLDVLLKACEAQQQGGGTALYTLDATQATYSKRRPGKGLKGGPFDQYDKNMEAALRKTGRAYEFIPTPIRRSRSLRNRKVRRATIRTTMQSPCLQTRRKMHEPLYTGLITPSRRPCHWKMSPRVDHLSSNSLSGSGADELEISEFIPRSGCGTPWGWSRIHSRRRISLLKMGLPCGSTDYFAANRSKGRLSQGRCGDASSSATSSEIFEASSTSSTESESSVFLESSPLLNSCCHERNHGCKEQVDGNTFTHSLHTGDTLQSAGRKSNPPGLNQKYMPKSFNDIVGQKLITQALCNALSSGKIAPMYVFCGPRGTGKTSCAKVFAAALNCACRDGQRPCGTCGECAAPRKGAVCKEFNARGKDIGLMKWLLHNVIWSPSSRYSVYVVNECQSLTSQSWNAFLKIVEEAPRNIVFILCTGSPEQLPHTVASRCRKFFFSKIKEAEIFKRLQSIALQEGIEADADAFKLIASTCNGSLRDAEIMLDQLGLLGQRISISIVQELMGLVPDDRLVDLLDLALSADNTINTVRNLKELLMQVAGAEPLGIMSQLACLITSILAAGGLPNRPVTSAGLRFFRAPELTREDTERLRRALKTLSEAEKQLRDNMSPADRTTWLTAALLQFADPLTGYKSAPYINDEVSSTNYIKRSSSSYNTSDVPEAALRPAVAHGPVRSHGNINERTPVEVTKQTKSKKKKKSRSPSGQYIITSDTQLHSIPSSYALAVESCGSPDASIKTECASSQYGMPGRLDTPEGVASNNWWRLGRARAGALLPQSSSCTSSDETTRDQQLADNDLQIEADHDPCELDDVWQRLLDAVQPDSLGKFLAAHGKLASLSLSKGFAVALLEFGQAKHASRAMRSRATLAYCFHSTLGYPVDIKVHHASSATEDEQQKDVLRPGSGADRLIRCSALINGSWNSPLGNTQAESELLLPADMKRHGADIPVFNMQSVHPLHLQPSSNRWSDLSLENTANLDTLNSSNFLPSSIKKHMSMEEKPDAGPMLGSTRSEVERCNDNASNCELQHVDSTSGSDNTADGHINEEPCSLNIFRHGGSDFGYSDIAEETHSATVAANVKENMRLESRTSVLACWSASQKGNAQVRRLQYDNSRRRPPGLLLSLCPCAKSSHQTL